MMKQLLLAAALCFSGVRPVLASTFGIVSFQTALDVAVRNGSTAPGMDLIQWTATGGNEQLWSAMYFPNDPGGHVARLQNVNSGLCITTDGVAGHPLFQLACDSNNPYQLWDYSAHRYYGFSNPTSGLYMDIEGASYNKGAEVIGWYSNSGMNQIFWATVSQASECFPSENDTSSAIVYQGLGWGYSAGRPASFGDKNNDVHYTTVDGDSVSYKFYGRSISYVSEISDGYGLVDVYVDGNLRQTVDANTSGVRNQGHQTLFTATNMDVGEHTITLVKRSGVYMLVDEFDVQP